MLLGFLIGCLVTTGCFSLGFLGLMLLDDWD